MQGGRGRAVRHWVVSAIAPLPPIQRAFRFRVIHARCEHPAPRGPHIVRGLNTDCEELPPAFLCHFMSRARLRTDGSIGRGKTNANKSLV